MHDEEDDESDDDNACYAYRVIKAGSLKTSWRQAQDVNELRYNPSLRGSSLYWSVALADDCHVGDVSGYLGSSFGDRLRTSLRV